MSCLLTEAVEDVGETDSSDEGNAGFLFRSEVTEASGFDLTSTNVLLETGGTVVTAGFEWNRNSMTVPLCGAISMDLPRRGKNSSRLPVLCCVEGSKTHPPIQNCEPVHLVDMPPAGAKVKSIPNPKPNLHDDIDEFNHVLKSCTDANCETCFNLDDVCEACEGNPAQNLVAGIAGAEDPRSPFSIPEWTTADLSDEQLSPLARVTEAMAQIELNQVTGTAYQVRQRFANLSKKSVAAIAFCIDSGASDNICCEESFFETLDKNAPVKCFKIVHGTAVIRSQGKGTVLFPITTTYGKKIYIRLHDVYYIPSQPFNLISVPRCIEAGWEDPRFSKCVWLWI